MITYEKYQFSRKSNGVRLYACEGVCLSSDTKPTTGIENGSKLMEMDTSKLYIFDKDNSTWREW